MMARPLIGVSTSEVRIAEQVQPIRYGEPPHREMALGLKYLQAIESAGGLPVVVPPLEPTAVEPLLERLSGICLSGGPDLDPETYHSRPHPQLGPTEPDLDRFELALARDADARGLPILAICRGAQALNVARGGSLHQHLPDDVGGPLHHRQSEPGDQATHRVEVAPASRLARVLGTTALDVNSFHHQGIRELGHGLHAVAWADDGVIEGIEASDRPFVLGVQWHAEGIVQRPEQVRLFEHFVEAAQELGEPRARPRAA
jgi:putative glutamine amidotransferase